MKRIITVMMEYIRPAGIGVIIYFTYRCGSNAAERFLILGPGIVMLMAGTIAFEGLFLGDVVAAKIGYSGGRQYQRQSALYSLAIALGALLVVILRWGVKAGAVVTVIELLFLLMSSINHAYSAFRERNLSRTNLMRPVLTLVLILYLVPIMIQALKMNAE